jgi:hypothetical protein
MREGSKRLRRLGLAAVFALAVSAAPALSQANPSCGVPAALGDGWTIDSPESAGFDGARLCRIADRLKETEANVHAVVVARHGRLVFEQYLPCYDEPWGLNDGQHEFDATTRHDMRSVSKSVVSKDVKWIAAQGLGGQRIFIVPELDLVVMTTSGLYGSGRQGQAALDILANFIIPYVRDNNTR